MLVYSAHLGTLDIDSVSCVMDFTVKNMSDNEDANSMQETASVSGSFDLHGSSSNSHAETESLTGILENASLGSTTGDIDSNGCVETESTCSLEETAAKIESALRRNLKMNDRPRNGIMKSDIVEKGTR